MNLRERVAEQEAETDERHDPAVGTVKGNHREVILIIPAQPKDWTNRLPTLASVKSWDRAPQGRNRIVKPIEPIIPPR